MKIGFTCPSCGFSGSLDAAYAGKTVRCKHCGHRSTVPEAGELEGDVYALDEAAMVPGGEIGHSPASGSTFVASTNEETMMASRPRRPARRKSRSVAPKRGASFAWHKWLIGFAAATVLALTVVALVVPRGMLIAAFAVILIGCAMLLAGYLVGAYGAFREDVLYGLLYVLIPFYTAYYIVTRWDDLWVWGACSTAGAGLIILGTEMARWSGLGA